MRDVTKVKDATILYLVVKRFNPSQRETLAALAIDDPEALLRCLIIHQLDVIHDYLVPFVDLNRDKRGMILDYGISQG